MQIRFPGLELREPLSPHPLAGALFGGGTGLIFGLLSSQASLGVPWRSAFFGYTMAGLVAGFVIGVSIPLFRNRFLAGVMVTLAMTPALAILWWSIDEQVTAGLVIFVGLCCGLIYSVLFWPRRPPQSPPPVATPKSPT